MPELSDFPAASQLMVVPFDTGTYGDGRTYEIDTSFEPYRRQSTRHTTIPSQRESINLEGKTGEGTVNTEGLWRLNVPDWSYGAGQLYADRDGSVANRFLASTGVNVFGLQYQATLLQATKQVRSTTGGQAPIVVTLGPYVFWAESTVVYWVTEWGGSPNSLTFAGSDFAGSEEITGLMVDDANLYVCTTKSCYMAQVFGGSSPGEAYPFVNQGTTPVAACGGRVFVGGWANQNLLYDLTSYPKTNASAPSDCEPLPWDFAGGILAQHSNPKWSWVGAALVDGTFYFTGIPLDHDSALVPNATGEIWRASFQINTQTGVQNTALPAPAIGLTLPPGEVCNAIFGYTNLCILGTTQGVRVCRSVSANDPEGNTGDLIAGPIIPNLLQPVGGWVTGFTANGRFVWFTWNGYNDTFVGGSIDNEAQSQNSDLVVLGRMDMETMVDDLTPAYASDLVLGTDGYVFSMAWDPITEGPILGINLSATNDNNGLWVQDSANLVDSGFIDSGLVTNNIPDDKIAAMVSCRFLGSGTIAFNIQADGGGYSSATPISPNTPSTTPELLDTLVRYEEANVSVVLSPSGSDTPILKRWTLKSIPAVVSGSENSYVCMLFSQIGSHGVKRSVDPYAELAWFEGLRLSQQPLTISEGNPAGTLYTAVAVVESIDWLPEHERDNGQAGWDGAAVITFKTIVG